MNILHKHILVSSLMVMSVHACIPCTSPCDSAEIIINEIMYAPLPGDPEWIELFNNSAESIDLMGWTIEDTDSTRPRIVAYRTTLIKTNCYVCIVQDSSDFTSVFPNISCPALQPLNGWTRLNNDGDRIVLRNSSGIIIDKLHYDDQWGGGAGTSLERIHPDWPTNSSWTWSTSVSPSGSTPCQQNSICASSLNGQAHISIQPDPFDTETTISYSLTVPTAIVKLHVYDIRGRLVRTLIDQEPSSGTGSIVWNGRDDQGRGLRMGVYIIYLEAINAKLGVLDRAKRSVVLAKRLD